MCEKKNPRIGRYDAVWFHAGTNVTDECINQNTRRRILFTVVGTAVSRNVCTVLGRYIRSY